MRILREKLEEEKQQVESLINKQRVLTSQFDEMAMREIQLTEENSQLARSLAMSKHDLKEVTLPLIRISYYLLIELVY